MSEMLEVEVSPAPLDQLSDILSAERARRLHEDAARARDSLGDRVVWHVSATAQGGGVAEMLQTLLAYGKGAQVENRWLVLDGDPAFFTITKRVHNMLHGEPGDGGNLGPGERARYVEVLETNLQTMLPRVSEGDIVLLHDPQTAGLARGLRNAGLRVAWRCHVGRDEPNALSNAAWTFLRPFLEEVDAYIFSRRVYAPAWLDAARLAVIAPSIDPFSAKNVPLAPKDVIGILTRVGLTSGSGAGGGAFQFVRRDGSSGNVRRHVDDGGLLVDSSLPPPPDARIVLQVSRWDRLKDMSGVMRGFTRLIAHQPGNTHLILAGPAVSAVSDDPEGAAVLQECVQLRRSLPDAPRARVHLASIPMDDIEENATIVNALQRHAHLVVQKSLVEGFGLTVAEAMWKERPVVASRVGGIQDQIVHRRDGLLVDDPSDLDAFAAALGVVLGDTRLAQRLGRGARTRVQNEFLVDRHLSQYVDVFSRVVARSDDLAYRPARTGDGRH